MTSVPAVIDAAVVVLEEDDGIIIIVVPMMLSFRLAVKSKAVACLNSFSRFLRTCMLFTSEFLKSCVSAISNDWCAGMGELSVLVVVAMVKVKVAEAVKEKVRARWRRCQRLFEPA
jgi:hypothetical protein